MKQPVQKSPLSVFFKLGDKVTKGDPIRKMSFDYYMLWIIFLAFGFVFVGNIWHFFTQGYALANLGWALFGLAIMWFQYFNLSNMYKLREYQKKSVLVEKEEDAEIDDVNKMLKGFQK